MKTRKVSRTPLKFKLIEKSKKRVCDMNCHKNILQTVEHMYANDIIPHKGDVIQDTEGLPYLVEGVSYAYHVNEGDSYISITLYIEY
jgi:hypothetical protein